MYTLSKRSGSKVHAIAIPCGSSPRERRREKVARFRRTRFQHLQISRTVALGVWRRQVRSFAWLFPSLSIRLETRAVAKQAPRRPAQTIANKYGSGGAQIMSKRSDKAFYDEAFGQIAQRAGSIHGLLDEFFGFLHSRTDFYVTYPIPSDPTTGQQYKMGFPEGKAEKILLDAFRKYPYKDYSSTAAAGHAAQAPPPSAPSKQPQQQRSIPPSQAPRDGSGASTNVASVPPPPSSSSSSSKIAGMQPALTEEGKQVPIGNGGIAEKYYWTQTLREVTVYVDVPPGTKSKVIQCALQPSSLRLVVADQVLIDGVLDDTIIASESMWTINHGGNSDVPQIVITLEKSRETWWSRVVVGDPQIDTCKVDSSKHIDEYDEETQAAIRKIVFQQRQKLAGIPTPDEQATQELLSKLPDPPL